MRSWPPLSTAAGGEAPYSENFASLNRNKRSVVLDLKDRAGVERAAAARGGCRSSGGELPPRGARAPRRRLRGGERAQPENRVLLDLGLWTDGPLRPQGCLRRYRAGHERSDERDRRARRRPGQVRRPGRRLLRRGSTRPTPSPPISCGPGRPAVAPVSTARCWAASSPWRRSRPASTSAPARRRACSAPRIRATRPTRHFARATRISSSRRETIGCSRRCAPRSGARKWPRTRVSPPSNFVRSTRTRSPRSSARSSPSAPRPSGSRRWTPAACPARPSTITRESSTTTRRSRTWGSSTR